MNRLSLIKPTYLDHYRKKQPITLLKHFNKLKKTVIRKETFGYQFSVSSVFSSMIEGNIMDLDTYLKFSESGMNTSSKSFKEIKDLIQAYDFAKDKALNLKNVLKAHETLSKTIISEKKYRGKLRDKEVYIYGGGVKIYTGASKDIVKQEIDKLFNDIAILKKRDLSITECFYFASMIHLVFAKIHPFADGNGRTARLIEKWFLAEKLGSKAWFINSEKLYQKRIKSYYKNIDIGPAYTNNNFNLSIPFLKMLPMALRIK